MSLFSSSLKRFTILAAALAPVALVTGCANMVGTASESNSISPAATITGNLHGGNQPISNALVTLYSAGTAGYGSPAKQIAQTNSSTDGNGTFQFTQNPVDSGNSSGVIDNSKPVYSCPTTGDPQMYIIAKGGSTQGPVSPVNNDAAFIIALGKCSGVGSLFVNMNEVTTVATLAALQQYFSPSIESLGYNGTAQSALGFANAVATISNLVNISTGAANTTFTPTSALSGVTVTGTPEAAKINTIADILASCINTTPSSSTNCQTLFDAATPPISPAVTSQPSPTPYEPAFDTVQAAYYMLVNPIDAGTQVTTCNGAPTTGNLDCLFQLSGATGAPFVGLASAPTDWTIGIGYAAPTANACSTGTFFNYPYNLAVDASGNVWFDNSPLSGIAANLVGVSSVGAPIACVGGDTITGSTYGVTVDTVGNVWMSSGAVAKALEYKSGSPVYWTTASADSEQIVADGNGNIFYADYTGKGIQEFVGAANAASPAASVQIGGPTGTSPYYMAVDGLDNVFVTQSSTTNTFYEYYPTTAGGNVNGYLSGTILTPGTNVYNSYGVAITSSNTATNSSSFVVLNGSAAAPGQTLLPVSVAESTATPALAPTITPGTLSAPCAGGIFKGRGLAIDGAGNSWVAAEATTNSIAEVSATGVALSPAFSSPSTCNSSSSTGSGGFQKPALIGTASTSDLHGVAIDPSGNVWVGQSTSPVGLIEIVGAAVPVVTPISAGLANNTVGTLP